MAEALGLASSIIAVADLAGKTISLTIKLKALWEEVKDVPVALLQKAEYLQDLEELLDLAEQDAAEDSTPTAIWNAINRARAAKNDVQDTIDAYTEELANRRRYKRRLAAAKFVIQKDDLRTVEQKLDRALELYKLANTVAHGRYGRLILKQLTEPTSAVVISTPNQSPIIDPGDSRGCSPSQIITVKAAKPRKNTIFEGSSALGRLCFDYYDETYSFSVRVPDWLGGKVYSAMVQRSIAGWQSFLSVYPTIHYFEDKVFDMLREDDVTALQKYLCKNNLTPRVHNSYGFNLLHFSLDKESVETAKWLLSCGLYPGSFNECNAFLALSSAERSILPVNCSFYRVLGDIARIDPEDITFSLDGTYFFKNGVTPLFIFLYQITTQWKPPEDLDQLLRSAITHWATILYESGFDLFQYGRNERDFYQDHGWYVSEETISRLDSEGYLMGIPYTCSLLGITYGALPTQWKLWWVTNDNNYAADFWNLVEGSNFNSSGFNVPGGWTDDFDDEDDDEDDERVPFIWSEYRKIRPPS
ncbi:unnamed protein product [Colletotrichum noveboracense]|uniref:NACHT-NTPase and P-loop NTPases N-terminal domain-containing protein n=1 Tax=Colletotrichum noveboracense TaxID=2664923 RepID=A0A9W4W928_9PEZI|nr:unnamed protein product [Colletotrichum noveboracense]